MNALWSLRPYFNKYKSLFFAGIICVLVSNLFRIIAPPVTGFVIDKLIATFASDESSSIHTGIDLHQHGISFMQGIFLEKSPESIISTGILIIFLFALLSGIFMFLMRQTLIVMSRKIEYDQKNDVYTHYQILDAAFLEKQSTGDLMNRISEDVSRVRMFTGPALMYLTNLICVIGFSLFFMFQTDARLSLITLMPLPVLAFLIYRMNLIIQKRSEQMQEKLSDLTTLSQQAFSGIRVIRSYIRETSIKNFFGKSADAYAKGAIELSKVESVYFPGIGLLIGISTILAVGVGAWDVVQGRPGSGVGHVVEFVMYIQLLMFPVSALGWSASMIKRAEVSQKRINEFLNYIPHIKTVTQTVNCKLNGVVRFNQVSFTYPNAKEKAIDRVSFELQPGEQIAIVGKTGSGKTTLASLLLRMYDPQEGEIYFNDKNAKDIDLSQLRKSISYVPQDVLLFSDTIKANILFGSSLTDINEINVAIEKACLHDEVARMHHGMDTIVGEKGITLSGGQKQRVSIARALLKTESLIAIFDDCLSAVDAETEKVLFRNIGSFFTQRTSILITHRLFNLTQYDRILVLDKGKLTEQGSHEYLMELKGTYYQLFQQQQERNSN